MWGLKAFCSRVNECFYRGDPAWAGVMLRKCVECLYRIHMGAHKVALAGNGPIGATWPREVESLPSLLITTTPSSLFR